MRDDRPIDNYPRIRDTGRFIMDNGVVPFVAGLYLVSRAWRGIDPGVSALMAFLLGIAFMMVLSTKYFDCEQEETEA